MRVFQFAFVGDPESSHLPHNYPKNCVAYTGTHDNNTLLGYLWELDDETRYEMLNYCGFTSLDWQGGLDSMIRTVLRSHANVAILPVQDLLGYGADTRMNKPGTANGNWQYRVTTEQLDKIDWNRFRSYNRLYGRSE
jgi:4-alpha-glucanotransferase